MADRRRKKDELDKFRQELLDSSDLDNETIDVLIEMGFKKVNTLRHLRESDLANIECHLNQAQIIILRGEIEELFKGMTRKNRLSSSTDASCSEKPKRTKNMPRSDSKTPSSSRQDRHGSPQNSGTEEPEIEDNPKFAGSYSERRADPSNSSNHHRMSRPKESQSHQEPEIEEIQRPPMHHINSSDQEHARCEIAKKHFTEGEYSEMENVLADIDEATRSARGRIRFGAMIMNVDFSQLYDCVTLQTNEFTPIHEVIRQQFSNLADFHQKILHQMGLPHENSTFSEWTVHTTAVFREDSNLQYGSDQWQRCIDKTEKLSRFLYNLNEPAKNISKSFILLILHIVNRAYLIRQRASPSDYRGLLRIATFCLPLCKLDFLKSINFCELKHDAYANATVMLGFNISDDILRVEMYHNRFIEVKNKLEELYNQCLEFSNNPRSEYIQENLDKITDDVELKWSAYMLKTKERQMPGSSSKHQHTRTRDEYVESIIKLCNCRSYSEVRREIIEAEDALQETEFKLKIGCRISSRYKYAFDSLSLPVDTFDNERSLFSHLRDRLFVLVTDCNEMLREMKIYSNDALAKWVELFFKFYSLDDFYESEKWQKMLTTGKNLVNDVPKGIKANGQTTIQMYIQLIVMLIKNAMITYKRLNHTDYLGHLRLSSMYLTMTKSSLLNSKWYTDFRHDGYQRNIINLGLCIMNGVITADIDVYQRFKDMKRTLDKLTIDCQGLRISTGSPEDRDKVKTIYEVIEQTRNSQTNMPRNDDHCDVNFIGRNEDVCRIVASAINSYNIREFEKMTVSLDEAEIFDTCDIRLPFAAMISTGFHQTLDFSNNIPESQGIEVVYNETYTNLDNLANDHAKIVMYMGEVESTELRSLVDYLFTVADIRPYTNEWDHLMKKAQAVVAYFQSLSKAGQCVTKCYVLLFLTVLHNFIATRNRLCRGEHHKLLPFVFACIPFCESVLTEKDAWIKTRFEVFEISILTTHSSLAAGQIPYAHWFSDHLAKVNELDTRANELGIVVCTQKQQLLKTQTAAKDLLAKSWPRMCISAALYYYHFGFYKGMAAILKATDKTKDAKDIRMNFAMRLSAVFETCVDQHNRVGEVTSLGNLLENAKCVLEWISEDHSNILKEMGLKNSNCLLVWVEKLLGIIDNKQTNSFTCSVWKEAEKQSLMAAKYIKKLSKPGRCISQAYLSFFMSFCMNFISRRNFFIEDDFITELQIILSVIKLCNAFETSNFSVRVKSRACTLAASLFNKITEFDNSSLKELNQLVTMVKEYKGLIQQYDEELLHENNAKKDGSSKDSKEKRENAQNEIGQKRMNNNCRNSGESQETGQVESKPLDFKQQLNDNGLSHRDLLEKNDEIDEKEGSTSQFDKVKSEVVEACNKVDMSEKEVQSGAEKLFEELDKAGIKVRDQPTTIYQGSKIILYKPQIDSLSIKSNLT